MNSLKRITVLLLATTLVLAAAALLIPKGAVAAVAAQVFLANHSVPTSNPLPTRDVGAQTVLVVDQTVTTNGLGSTFIGPVDVSMFKEIRVWETVLTGFNDYSLYAALPDPANTGGRIVLDDINASKNGVGSKTYDIVWPKLEVVLVSGINGPSTVHVLVYGRSN